MRVPVRSRVISIADIWRAATSRRCVNAGWSKGRVDGVQRLVAWLLRALPRATSRGSGVGGAIMGAHDSGHTGALGESERMTSLLARWSDACGQRGGYHAGGMWVARGRGGRAGPPLVRRRRGRVTLLAGGLSSTAWRRVVAVDERVCVVRAWLGSEWCCAGTAWETQHSGAGRLWWRVAAICARQGRRHMRLAMGPQRSRGRQAVLRRRPPWPPRLGRPVKYGDGTPWRGSSGTEVVEGRPGGSSQSEQRGVVGRNMGRR